MPNPVPSPLKKAAAHMMFYKSKKSFIRPSLCLQKGPLILKNNIWHLGEVEGWGKQLHFVCHDPALRNQPEDPPLRGQHHLHKEYICSKSWKSILPSWVSRRILPLGGQHHLYEAYCKSCKRILPWWVSRRILPLGFRIIFMKSTASHARESCPQKPAEGSSP